LVSQHLARRTTACLVSLLLIGAGLGPSAHAQSSGSPADTLRNILSAACAQDATQFAANLTFRNADAFAHMTKAAQTTLLKRFVLLDQAGEPRAEKDDHGNLVIYCVTPDLTTQMQFGKAELRDNLAYVPLVAKDATDTAGTNAHRILMGLVKENGQWKLLSLGLLLLDLPTLGEEWDRAEMQNNEKSALASMKQLAAAIEKYRVTYTRLPSALADLGPPDKGAPKSDQAGLLEKDLADGRKDGYFFRYAIVGASDTGAPAKYELAAIPLDYGRTGTKSFYRDSTGVLHAGDHQGAVGTQLDPKVE
jgi:hypothetical protein